MLGGGTPAGEETLGTIASAVATVALAGLGSFPADLDGSGTGEERTIGGIRLRWCPPGTFTMGSPPDELDRRPDEARVEVTLTCGFWAGKYEVTQGDWRRVVGKLPGPPTAELPEGDNDPVGNVNFAQAEGFCRKLTERARRSGELPEGWEFRLPAEAQWEYACRAGKVCVAGDGRGSRASSGCGATGGVAPGRPATVQGRRRRGWRGDHADAPCYSDMILRYYQQTLDCGPANVAIFRGISIHGRDPACRYGPGR
jgi:hypothetical protein